MYMIKNAHVFSPEDIGIQDVLVGGGKILKMAENLPVEEAYGITVIDGSGKCLMPGLIDSHVHILGGGGEGGAKTRTPEIMLSDIVTGGVTTIVGCLGTDGCTRTMSNLLAKAKGLEEEGITTYVYTGSYQVPVRTLWELGRLLYLTTVLLNHPKRNLPELSQIPEWAGFCQEKLV